jgi:superfamily II DNA or RNA helicase/very-short-patch-repair endonuclease
MKLPIKDEAQLRGTLLRHWDSMVQLPHVGPANTVKTQEGSMPPLGAIGAIDNRSSPALKVALFRSLFRGRENVYARRFESRKSGRSGYQPDCANEWVRDICEKPRIKCTDCPHQRFRPLTDAVITWHLQGQDDVGAPFTMGVYPMLQDETCFFLAVDFDKSGWCADAGAFMETCRALNIPAALERSRSGNGAHVWIFLARAIPASVARRLGAHIITETMERRPELGLRSYDRFFPNQDTLPKGGFGNLIALPLQKRPRDCGNSVFLDSNLAPHPDQWAFLSAIQKIDRPTVEDVIERAEARGRVVGVLVLPTEEEICAPWQIPPSHRRKLSPIAGPLPEKLELILANDVYIAKEALPPALRNQLLRLASFQNPEFYRAQAMRVPVYDKSRIISCAEDHFSYISLPRGCLDDLQRLCADLKISVTVRDERYPGLPLQAEFCGELRPEQLVAAQAMLARDTGVLSATTAFGKTVIGAWLIAKRRVNTLVLVHRRQLLDQWVERLRSFLDLPEKSIGQIGGGRKRFTGALDVALLQSLVRKGMVDDRVAEYGHVIVDECHHLPAYSFEQVARHAKAKYFTGLTATVARKDGHHPIVFMQCGPVRYRVDAKSQAIIRPFEHHAFIRPTGFRPLREPHADERIRFNDLCTELMNDEARNSLICEEVRAVVNERRSPVILTERKEHLDRLSSLLSPRVRHLITLRGGMGRKEVKAVAERLAAIPREEERVLLATGRYLGEGFDDARLDTLFLTMPVSWQGTIAQYVGRLHRLFDGKREVRVYDYADLNVPVLARMFDRRCRGYEAVGYKVLLPASAVPGWPSDVPLPVDPQWKRDYAASVGRLIRDGVDAPLGSLFVQVAREFKPDAEGTARARSATEAFLYRRLETLQTTAGRFRLNAELSIAFDGWGRMEVDLLCPVARLVIELDGAQHLGNVEAYRRDRRKDQLLQENGYFVLRFLAEDVGKRLDLVLDAIERAVISRTRSD